MLRLNLGASDHRMSGYMSVDIAPPADVVCDLREPWPWGDSTVDDIYAHDVAEHMNQIWFMNEAFRVLRPGGKLDLAVPAVALADGRVNPGAFCDPTHVSWWSLDTKYYYNVEWNNPQGERGRLGPAYGIKALFKGEWKMIEYGAGPEKRSKVLAILEAVK